MIIPAAILQELQRRAASGAGLWLAYSGGLDSSALLHALVQHAPLRAHLRVLHVNHGLSPHAQDWQQHCAAQCADYGLPFFAEKVLVRAQGRGIEAAAREQRHAVFKRCLEPGHVLLTAHHADDQSETVLLRLLRGAGLEGLGAMAAWQSYASGFVCRPLLECARAQLQAYAERHAVAWVDDDSNADTRFDRNFLRSQVLPRFCERWPAAVAQINQAAQHLRGAAALLEDYVAEDFRRCDPQPSRLGESLDIETLVALSEPRRAAVLRYWRRARGESAPATRQLAEVASLLTAREDAQPLLRWGEQVLRRFQNRLYLEAPLAEKPMPAHFEAVLIPGVALSVFGGFTLLLQTDGPFAGQFVVRPLNRAVRCRPQGRAHSQRLKKLLQEYKLEPWLRPWVPLIYVGDELVAVGDLFRCDSAARFGVENVFWFYEPERQLE